MVELQLTFFLHGLDALSIVDVSIVYCVARFKRKLTSEEVWRIFCRDWILSFVGAPEVIWVDRASNLASQFFASVKNAASDGEAY
jgi:hypothetical protein